jgi:hypothetical protein
MGSMHAIPMLALQRGDLPPGMVELLKRLDEDARRRWTIRCPACQWQPAPTSQWFCQDADAPEHFSPGCSTAWNTFMTRGRCPGCAHQWRWTACLKCNTWSPHEAWYTPDEDDDPSS